MAKARPLLQNFKFIITEGIVGQRLDKALATDERIVSRSKATSLIDLGYVRLGEKAVKPAHRTSLGEEFDVALPLDEPSELTPYDLKLEIIHEDADVIVINKPSGLVVHPAQGHQNDTLVNALLHYTNRLAQGFVRTRPGIVHRLDKETSGLIVVAKTDKALTSLAKQFKRKTVHRIYWAVTFGEFKDLSGTITSHLKRHPTDRKRFASERLHPESTPTGKLAVTHYKVMKTHSSGLSLVQLQLETGRTHQIRVHLSENQHPVVADPMYCNSQRLKSLRSVSLRNEISEVPHLMLHAAELGFVHPTTHEILKFKTDWPEELHPILKRLEFL